ncbi:hypothetical protein WG922_11745 [Ramlibacter sp. AN1015]|uniref:hypothetical protein n=1 Tax=Ramlibacter sp. AN1015 TaxID=3133428 RepID=UPI0030C50E95
MSVLLDRLDGVFGTFMLGETVLALVVLALAFTAPRLGERGLGRVEAGAARLLATPVRQIAAVGLLALLLRAALLPWIGPAQPVVHDEQSLLLQAQTHLLGRLALPTHPFWEHFETFHVNQVPAYASVYVPGRGAPLALGLLLAGEAWAGIWIATVAMAMAATWMLQAWVPAPYALLGGMLVVLRFGLFSYWINGFWGGSFTAFGAMLVVGALPRLLARPGWGLGAVLGTGAAILATSRPYEGALLCLPVAALLAWRFLRPARPGWRGGFARAAVPALACVAAAVGLLAAHNLATTGHAMRSAYGVNRLAYAEAPAFLTSAPVASERRGPAHMRAFYAEEARPHARRTSAKGLVAGVAAKVWHTWRFYVGPIFTVAFLAGLWALRRNVFVPAALGFFLAGFALETWNFPHYTAPAMPLLLIVLMRGFAQLRGWSWRGRPTGRFLTRAMPAALGAALLLPASAAILGTPRLESNRTLVCCSIGTGALRQVLDARLAALPGRHLVMVRSGAHNPVHYELVYNEADIDAARVVWARALGPDRDARLAEHFPGHRVWAFDWRPDLPQAYTLELLREPQPRGPSSADGHAPTVVAGRGPAP